MVVTLPFTDKPCPVKVVSADVTTAFDSKVTSPATLTRDKSATAAGLLKSTVPNVLDATESTTETTWTAVPLNTVVKPVPATNPPTDETEKPPCTTTVPASSFPPSAPPPEGHRALGVQRV